MKESCQALCCSENSEPHRFRAVLIHCAMLQLQIAGQEPLPSWKICLTKECAPKPKLRSNSQMSPSPAEHTARVAASAMARSNHDQVLLLRVHIRNPHAAGRNSFPSCQQGTCSFPLMGTRYAQCCRLWTRYATGPEVRGTCVFFSACARV